MVADAFWVLHLDHGILRRYYLSDLNRKDDRPYEGGNNSEINLDESGTGWNLFNPRTKVVEERHLCEPYAIDEENFITVYRYPEQDGKARKALENLAKRHNREKTQGASR